MSPCLREAPEFGMPGIYSYILYPLSLSSLLPMFTPSSSFSPLPQKSVAATVEAPMCPEFVLYKLCYISATILSILSISFSFSSSISSFWLISLSWRMRSCSLFSISWCFFYMCSMFLLRARSLSLILTFGRLSKSSTFGLCLDSGFSIHLMTRISSSLYCCGILE